MKTFGTAYNTGEDGDDALFFPDHRCLLCNGTGRSTKGDTCVVCVGYGWLKSAPHQVPEGWSEPFRAYEDDAIKGVFHALDPRIDPLGPEAQKLMREPPSTVVGKLGGG
jgi:hypothetical protein